ncbi:hypothetical protein [Solibacillus sp. FSL K6-1523]|uniref:hypothetical protein n=1 Tax=Solibacillus sp. FSL K6-1523 TaxID=2921471 RepID=UPI0030FCC152
MPKAKVGVLDLRTWDFAQTGVVKLDGDWDYYEGDGLRIVKIENAETLIEQRFGIFKLVF